MRPAAPLRLLLQPVHAAATEAVHGVAVADAVERLTAIALAEDERTRRQRLHLQSERLTVHRRAGLAARVLHVDVDRLVSAEQAHQPSLQGPRLFHGSATVRSPGGVREARPRATAAAARPSAGGQATRGSAAR